VAEIAVWAGLAGYGNCNCCAGFPGIDFWLVREATRDVLFSATLSVPLFFSRLGVHQMQRTRRPQRASHGMNRRCSNLNWEQLEARRLLAADILAREFVAGELLVQYSPQATLAQQANARAAIGGEVKEVIQSRVMQEAGFGRLERVSLGKGVDLLQAIEALERNPAVAYAEPNYIYRKAAVSNDTYYTNGSLWGMYGDDSPAAGPAGTTNQFGIQAEKAWAANLTGSSSVVVGIVDEGYQVTHPDLDANAWVNPFETAGDGIDNDGNGYVDDIYGWDFVNNDNSVYDGTADDHGTHVAGTIGAEGGNGSGVVGVNWNVKMISAKFLGTNGGTTANAVRAIDYLTDLKTRHGINLVASNNSWGGGGYSQSLHDAIIRHAKQNILFVAAAGNSASNNDTTASYPSNYNTTVGTSTQTPASYDGVIAVASITSTGGVSSFSNFGATSVDIGAPGSGIWSTVPSNTYASYNGTSMATPHVTGAVALYASAQSGPVSASAIRQALLGSVTPTTSLVGKTVTGGRLNIYAALNLSAGPAISVSNPTPGSQTTEAGGTVTFNVVLATQPTSNVTIPVSSNDVTEGTVSTSALTFTSANWNVPQTVTVTGVNDFADDSNIAYTIVLGAATSADAAYSGRDASDVALTNLDDDTAGITLGAPSGTTTTEAGGAVTFTARLNSQPTANVTIGLSSSDTTEGNVNSSAVVFTPANWNVVQTITVTGVDDTIFDGNIAYNVIVAASTSSDPLYSGINPADVALTNLDNETAPPTKFYVVDDATQNRTFEYAADGSAVENYATSSGNSAPRGVAMTAAGDKTWVVDANRNVYVYDTSGGLLGSWVAGRLANSASVQGIATDGVNIWIVDAQSDRVFYYANAATRLSGTQTATSFALNVSNTSPTDLVFGSDGSNRYLWVVNSSTTDRVFRYSVASTGGITALNSWTLNSANSTPTGITLDPSNGSFDIWVVDSGTDRVYRYANARNLTSPTLTSSFALAAGNANPQGIADPPPPGSSGERLEPEALFGSAGFLSPLQPLAGLRPAGYSAPAEPSPNSSVSAPRAIQLQPNLLLVSANTPESAWSAHAGWTAADSDRQVGREPVAALAADPLATVDAAFAEWN
jgi:subtilisin family serine protease